ncbi:hypothetical protein ACWGLE_25200 [Streptomyces sp. NPDC055897]
MTIQDLIKNVAARDLTTFARAIPSRADHLLTKEGGIIPTLVQDEVKWRVKDNGRYVNAAKYRAFDASVPFASREAWQTTREGMLPPLGQKLLVGEQEQILLETSRGADEDRLIELLYDNTERRAERPETEAFAPRGSMPIFDGAVCSLRTRGWTLRQRGTHSAGPAGEKSGADRPEAARPG